MRWLLEGGAGLVVVEMNTRWYVWFRIVDFNAGRGIRGKRGVRCFE